MRGVERDGNINRLKSYETLVCEAYDVYIYLRVAISC